MGGRDSRLRCGDASCKRVRKKPGGGNKRRKRRENPRELQNTHNIDTVCRPLDCKSAEVTLE